MSFLVLPCLGKATGAWDLWDLGGNKLVAGVMGSRVFRDNGQLTFFGSCENSSEPGLQMGSSQ